VDGLHGKQAAVLRLDPRNGEIKIIASGGLLKQKVGPLAAAPDGFIYAVNDRGIHGEGDEIVRIDPVSGAVSVVAPCPKGAAGLCMDIDGQDLLVAVNEPAELRLLRGKTWIPWAAWQPTGTPFGLTLDNRGRVFVGITRPDPEERSQVLEIGRSAEHAIRTAATFSKQWVGNGGGGLAVDANGNFLVGSTGIEDRILRVDGLTGAVSTLSSKGALDGGPQLAVVPGSTPKDNDAQQKRKEKSMAN
jgi:hypothetical protein